MKMQAVYRHVEPDVEVVDIDGCHLILAGTKAFFFHLFKTMNCEEKAKQELYPYLLPEIKKAKEKAAAAAKQTAAQSL